MRVSPLGLYFASDLAMVVEQAALSALPTHCHEIGIDSARIMASASALAAESIGEKFDRKRFLTNLLSTAKTEEFQFQINHALALRSFDSLFVFGNTIEAHRSVMTSVMCFVDSPDSYTETVSRAIGQGDDVDTIAAMAGTLSGARLGISGIPKHLVDCLENNHQGKNFLFELADMLWEKYQKKNVGN